MHTLENESCPWKALRIHPGKGILGAEVCVAVFYRPLTSLIVWPQFLADSAANLWQ